MYLISYYSQMQKKTLLLAVLGSLALLPFASFADMVPENHRLVSGCAKVVENPELGGISLFEKISSVVGNERLKINQISYGTCLDKWYKFNILNIIVKDAQNVEHDLWSVQTYGWTIEKTNPLSGWEKHYQVVKTLTGYALDLVYHAEQLTSGETKVVLDKEIKKTDKDVEKTDKDVEKSDKDVEKSEVKNLFSDVTTNHVYAKAIELLKNKGIIWGYPDGTYRAENSLSRAELVKIMVWALGVDKSSCVASNRSTAAQLKTNGFKDVSTSDWFANDLCVAKSLGIIKGYPDGNFKPNKSVSVAEAAKIVIVGLAKQKLSEGNPWYQSYVDYLVQKNAVPTTVWSYTAAINRWETAQLISSFLN